MHINVVKLHKIIHFVGYCCQDTDFLKQEERLDKKTCTFVSTPKGISENTRQFEIINSSPTLMGE